METKDYRLSIAPMMDWTDRHFRFFMRQITKQTLLYTEMITAEAILRGERSKLLNFSQEEHPLCLQIGGSDPKKLAEAAAIGEAWGYDRINLNVGCPSDRVQEGRFGACLMLEPKLVRTCIEAMRDRVSVPVTVKHRIGVDEYSSYEWMKGFVEEVALGGCAHFTIHARSAWLKGLSPKENREIPPLRYDEVHRLRAERSDLWIEINGGILSLEQAAEHTKYVDAVMIGRAAYFDPFLFVDADSCFFEQSPPHRTRSGVMKAMRSYLEEQASKGHLHAVTRHMMGLWHGKRGARNWRRFLSEIPQESASLSLKKYDNILDSFSSIEEEPDEN